MFLTYKKKMAIVVLIAIFFVALDRFFKILALKEVSFLILGDFIKFSLAKNYFIAFSLPVYGWFLNVVITAIIAILIIYSLNYYKKKIFLVTASLTFIVFGAISNLLDRFKYGFVVDYLDTQFFTVFNIADSMIVIGVIFVFIFLLHQDNIKKGEF